jgi:hypothetical protein
MASNILDGKKSWLPIWTEKEVERYYARWPLGTKQRVWFNILVFTGLHRRDALRLGRQHVRDGIDTLRAEKSRETFGTACMWACKAADVLGRSVHECRKLARHRLQRTARAWRS